MLACAVPTHVPELPADLESHRSFACTSGHRKQDSFFALQHRLNDAVDGDFLVVALALADRRVGRSQKPVCGLLIWDFLAGAKSLPELGGVRKCIEFALFASRKVEFDNPVTVRRICEFKAESGRVVLGLL